MDITHVCWLAAATVLRPKLTTRPAAAPAPPAPLPLFSACESAAALWQAMRLPARRSAALRCCRCSARRRTDSEPQPEAESDGMHPASLSGMRRRLGRAQYPPTDAGFEWSSKMIFKLHKWSFKIIYRIPSTIYLIGIASPRRVRDFNLKLSNSVTVVSRVYESDLSSLEELCPSLGSITSAS